MIQLVVEKPAFFKSQVAGEVWSEVPRVDPSELSRWRTMDAAAILTALAGHSKRCTTTFDPVKDPLTIRWHANVHGCDFELLLISPKFLDTRVEKSGGGVVDLTLRLLRADFKTAARLLRKRNL